MIGRASRLARENILDITPYVPGKPIDETRRELGLERIIKLASNENCLGPSPKAVKAIAEHIHTCHLYPDGAAYTLKQELASRFNLEPTSFLVGNGSDELLRLIAETFLHEGEEVVFGWPSFSEYVFVAKLMAATIRRVPLREHTYNLEAVARAIGPATKIVIVCNPNNPTGTLLRAQEVRRFLDRIPGDVLVIMDEAYAEYVDDPDYPNSVQLIGKGYNLIALRTFSKIYGLAGLRVGYAMADPETIEVMNRSREPFNVNSLAQVGATAALGDLEHLEASRKVTIEGKRQIYQAFDEMNLCYVPTSTNFILVDIGREARGVFKALLKKGVIVRSAHGFGLPTHIRVTIGTREENEVFLGALKEVLGQPQEA